MMKILVSVMFCLFLIITPVHYASANPSECDLGDRICALIDSIIDDSIERFRAALQAALENVFAGTPLPEPALPDPTADPTSDDSYERWSHFRQDRNHEGQTPVIKHYRWNYKHGAEHLTIGFADHPHWWDVAANHDGVDVRYKLVDDAYGIGKDPNGGTGTLYAIQEFINKTEFIRAYQTPPLVRIGETTPELVDLTIRSIQLLNEALPDNFQIRVDPNPKTTSALPPHGEIHIDFKPKALWPVTRPASVVGHTRWPVISYVPGRTASRFSAQVFIDTAFTERSTEEHVLRMITHEFMHAMGVLGHYPNDDPNAGWMTLMTSNPDRRPASPGDQILFFWDRWALFERYSPYSTGSWDWDTPAVHGCIDTDEVCFGASVTMRHISPWASDRGNPPDTNLADNQKLSGTVEWEGRLIGMTPYSQVVGGKAVLSIDIADLDGQLDFTNMEYWPVKQKPGAIGTGRRWNDGDLNYGVEVRANGFIQDGTGDAGTITGIFAGASHEYMTGVLKRNDLGAGFGGKR